MFNGQPQNQPPGRHRRRRGISAAPSPSGEGEITRIRSASRRFVKMGQICNSASPPPIPRHFRYWFFPTACASESAREFSFLGHTGSRRQRNLKFYSHFKRPFTLKRYRGGLSQHRGRVGGEYVCVTLKGGGKSRFLRHGCR